MNRIVVLIEGGVIQNIVGDPAEVVIIDYDTDGADECDPYVKEIDGEQVYVCKMETGVDEPFVETAFQKAEEGA